MRGVLCLRCMFVLCGSGVCLSLPPQAYYNTRIPMLKTPLMVLIDYRGFRLTCISLVPIDTSTIKYGSADGGVTVHTGTLCVAECVAC